MPEPDELDAARLLFPVGDRVSGRVSSVPHPGRIGIFIDLGQPPAGFVDILKLPAFAGYLEVQAIDIYGRAGETVVAQLRTKAETLGTGVVRVHDHHAGFSYR